MFSKALIDYKKQGNLQQLTPVLVGLFTEDPQNYPFFKGSYKNVQFKRNILWYDYLMNICIYNFMLSMVLIS